MSTSRLGRPDTEADIRIRTLLDESPRRSFVVKAGAGSGKTTSLIKALNHIERTHGTDLRSNGQRVACITYTEVAAAEITRDVGISDLLHVSTIHSFLWTAVKPFQRDLNKWVEEHLYKRISKLEDQLAGARKDSTRAIYGRRLDRAKDDLLKLPRVNHFTYQGASRYGGGVLGHHDVIAAGPELILGYELLAKIVSRRFPFILVDESQDTFPSVVNALAFVAEVAPDDFTLAFFGDPAQMIYTTGVGPIALRAGWELVEKPDNFRCPTKVLRLINTIRATIDPLSQTGGRTKYKNGQEVAVCGSVDIFALPADAHRTEHLRFVREWLAREYSDDIWANDSVGSNDLQILVIEHRLAAERLGFAGLFGVFEKAPAGLEIDFREGNAWPLQVFRDFILPLCDSVSLGRNSQVVRLLRRERPDLLLIDASDENGPAAHLRAVKRRVLDLTKLVNSNSSTVKDALLAVREAQFAVIDERLDDLLEKPGLVDSDDDESYLEGFLGTPIVEIRAYQRYVEGLSPYATHQGVKGEEFPRVLVVLDDSGSNYNLFSYDKLFGFTALSGTDRANIDRGSESVLDRTRRLLYVCCSRATQALAIAIYTADVTNAVETLTTTKQLGSVSIRTLRDLH